MRDAKDMKDMKMKSTLLGRLLCLFRLVREQGELVERLKLDYEAAVADFDEASADRAQCATQLVEVERARDRLEVELAAARAQIPPPRPAARFTREGLPDEQVQAVLAGTAGLPLMQAIMQKIDEASIRKMDASAAPPRADYTEANRTHDAGGVDALTELKGELQVLTAAKREAKPETA